MTLEKSIKVCDALGSKCDGFIFLETNEKELGYSSFLEKIDRNDMLTNSDNINFISYIKKGVTTNSLNTTQNTQSTSTGIPKPIQNVEIIPKGQRFNIVDCAIPSNKDYDMLKTLGTLKECRDACINNPGCNGFSRQKDAGETDKAECILKKAFYNDIKICKDSNTHVSYVRDGQIEAERNYRAEQLRIQQEKERIEKEAEEKKRKELICNKKLMPNNECMIMYGPWFRDSAVGLVDYISVNHNDEKVYIKFDDNYTKMRCINGESRYYKGPILDYKPCNWTQYALAPPNVYQVRKGQDNECSKDCNWKSTNSCIFPSYRREGTACISNNGNPTYVGLDTYNKDQLNGWLYTLFERDSGNSGGQTESKVVYDYWKKCKDVPGYGFLYNNDFEKIMKDNENNNKIIYNGGSMSEINISGKIYQAFTFTSNGTIQFGSGSGKSYVGISFIIVGGGGGGSSGGGGGGRVYSCPHPWRVAIQQNLRYNIVIGKGGIGTKSFERNGENGGDTLFYPEGKTDERARKIVAKGGGGGGGFRKSGNAGGSSGGSGADTSSDSPNTISGEGLEAVSFGNKGGKGPANEGYVGGSGGGGAGKPGQSGTTAQWRRNGWSWTSLGFGGKGGDGIESAISGSSVYYGGGGGGGANTNSIQADRNFGLGGKGGGGNGSVDSGNTHPFTGIGDNGQDGTGGGGGGGDPEGRGGNGGSGVVIILIEKNAKGGPFFR
jgi:hypothetical protein